MKDPFLIKNFNHSEFKKGYLMLYYIALLYILKEVFLGDTLTNKKMSKIILPEDMKRKVIFLKK